MKRMWKKSKIAILILILLLSCIILVAFGCQEKQQDLRSAAKVTRTTYQFVNAVKDLPYADVFEQQENSLRVEVNCDTERFSKSDLGVMAPYVQLYASRYFDVSYDDVVELSLTEPFTAYVYVQKDDVALKFDLTIVRRHVFSEWAVTSDSTCTEEGAKERTCSHCHLVESVVIDPLGHDYTEWTVVRPVTCLEESERVRTCRRCDVEDREITPAPGHDVVHHDGKKSCTEPWYEAYDTCTRCDYSTQVIHPATGHTEVIDPAREVSCTEDGYSEGSHCSVCGEVLVPQSVYPAPGHTPVEKSRTPATCTEDGVIVCECEVCHQEVRESLPALGHDFTDNVCSRCGYRVAIGLKYRLVEEGAYYVSSIGTFNESELYVPATYEGMPVIGIDENAFRNATQLTSLRLPASIAYIGPNALRGCTSLVDLSVPRTLYDKNLMTAAFGDYAQYVVYGDFTPNESGTYVSPRTSANSSSQMEIIFQTEGYFEMKYKVSSEPNYDKLQIYYNGMPMDTVSGETNYFIFARETVAIGDVVRITYSKDSGVDGGSDCGYVRISDDAIPDSLRELHVTSGTVRNTIFFSEGSVTSVCLEWAEEPISDFELEAAYYHPVYFKGTIDEWRVLTSYYPVLEGKTDLYIYAEGHGSEWNWQYEDGRIIVGPYGEHSFENAEYTCVDRVCSCGYRLLAVTTNPTHKYSAWEVRAASCTEDGARTRHCELCGRVQNEILPATGHTSSDWIVTKAATCTVDGEKITKCTVCNVTLSREVIPASHTYVNGECIICGATMPVYTRVNADGAAAENGEYILFGNYPQTQVKDNALIDALNAAVNGFPTPNSSGIWRSYEYYVNGSNTTDYMWYTDRKYQGETYRGVYFTSYRPLATYAQSASNSSLQGDNGYYTSIAYWFKYEPIKWRILEDDNGEALILCEMILDGREYYPANDTSSFEHNGGTGYANDYALSDIRAWLNDTFYRTAFTSLEKNIILLTTVENGLASANPNAAAAFNEGVNPYVCTDTEDRVFLLSAQQVTNAAYGFGSVPSSTNAARNKYSTDYALSQGVWKVPGSSDDRAGYWWLRSPLATDAASAQTVSYGGIVGNGNSVLLTYYGIVPALRIRLHDPIYTRVDADGVKSEDGEYLLFGKYPQTQVTDEAVLAVLNAAVGLPSATDSGEWTSYGYYQNGRNDTAYMWYVDRTYKGARYRGVYFTSYRPYYTTADGTQDFSFQDDNGYVRSSGAYWFKYDPIKWRILEEENQEALLLAELILDSREYDYADSTDTNNYKDSTIRAWLNDTFYNTAFSDLQKEIILLTTVQNGARSTNPNNNASQWNNGVNNYASEDTADRIFFLSEEEVTNADYGFAESSAVGDPARAKQRSDYAAAQGANASVVTGYEGNAGWWLRSPNYKNGNSVYSVTFRGGADGSSNYMRSTDVGVVPALRIKLRDSKTPKWSEGLAFAMTGDGTYEVTGIGSCKDTDLVIPTKHEGKAVTAVADNAFKGNVALTSVVLPRSLKTVGEYAFSACSEMGSVSIPGSVTVIGTRAFNNCKALISVSLPSGVTTLQDYAFSGCTKLTSISLPATLTAVGHGAFIGCNSIVQVTVAEGNPVYHSADNCLIDTENKTLLVGSASGVIPSDGSVTSIDGSAFRYASFTSVSIPEGVASIDGFFRCADLTTVSLPASLTTLAPDAFAFCSALSEIRFAGTLEQWCALSGLNGLMWDGVQGRALYIGGQRVTGTLTIPSTVTSIGKFAFCACTDVTSINLPLSVTNIGNYAFNGCTALTDVYYDGTADEAAAISVQMGNDVLSSATWHYIELAYALKSDNTYEVTGIGTYRDNDLVIPASRGGRAVTSVAANAFKDNATLTSVTIPASVKSLGASAFDNCTALSHTYYTGTLAEWCVMSVNGTKATPIACSHNLYIDGELVTDLVIPDTVTELGKYTFIYNTALTSVTIPATMTAIGSAAFDYCTSLTRVNYKGTLVGWCGITFASLSANPVHHAKDLYIGDTIVKDLVIPSTVTEVKSFAFANASITSAVVPATVTAIGQGAFYACASMSEITVPFVGNRAGVTASDTYQYPMGYIFGTHTNGTPVVQSYIAGTTNNTTEATFYVPASLRKVTVTGGYIPRNAFMNFNMLTSVTLGEGVTAIGEDAFTGCSLLESMTIPFVGNRAGVTANDTYQYPMGYIFGTAAYNGGMPVKQYYYGATLNATIFDTYYIPRRLHSVTVTGGYIPRAAFYSCAGLTAVTIGSGVTSIGVDAFINCYRLVEVVNLTALTFTKGATSYGSVAYYAKDIYTTADYVSKLSVDENGYILYTSGNTVSVVRYLGTDTDITIPAGATEIGKNAFINCSDLTSVSIPSSVNTIEYRAFAYCDGLTSFVIPSTVSVVENDAFYMCSGMTSITLSSTMKNINTKVFYGCSKLTTLTIPASVTYIGSNAFYHCCLDSVTVEEGNTKYHSAGNCLIETSTGKLILGTNNSVIPTDGSVTAIGDYAFYECSKLSVAIIPDSVTTIGMGAFRDCKGMTAVSVGSGVTSIGANAFSGCTALNVVNYTGTIAQWCNINFNNSSDANPLDAGHNWYLNGTLVTDLVIPEEVPAVAARAFTGCTSITSLTIPASVTSIGIYAFDACSGLTSITVADGNTVYHSAGNCLIETSSKTLIRGCQNSVIPSDGSVTVIGDSAFWHCDTLTAIDIPATVTAIERDAFIACSLTSVTIPGGVTSIGTLAFQKCRLLADIYYEGTEAQWKAISKGTAWDQNAGADTVNGTYTMHYTMSASQGLAYSLKGDDNYEVTGIGSFTGSDLVIPDTYNNKSVTSIAANAFKDCTSITSATIPGSVTSIGQGAFSGCSSLETMTIPFVGAEAGKTENDTYQYPFGYIFGTTSYTGGTTTSQYYYGTSTTSTTSTQYVIPSSLRRVTVTGGNLLYGAFYNCKMIESVTLEDGVNIIGTRAFYYCSALTSVTLPSDLTAIPAYTFYNCTALSVVTIPSGVTSIGSNAFGSCRSLLSITIPASVTSIGNQAFGNCYKLIEVCNLSSLTIQAGSSGNGYVGYYAQNVYTTVGGSKLSANADGYVLYTDGATVRLMSYVGTATELSIPANVTIIHNYAFYNRSDLLSVTIPNSVTSIGNYAFSGCSALTSMTIPFVGAEAGKTENDTYQYPFGYIFGTTSYTGGTPTSQYYYGTSTTSRTSTQYVIPSSLRRVTVTGGNLLYCAFYNCKMIESVTLEDGVNIIGTQAFYNCSALTSVTLPSDLTAIPAYTFYNCTALSVVTIPSGVTSIGSDAFGSCRSLLSITIPASVTSIGSTAFYNCYKLIEVCNLSSLTIQAGSSGNGYVGYYAQNVYTTVGGSKLSANADGYVLYTDGDTVRLVSYVGTSTELSVPANVTIIHDYAFYNRRDLLSVTIPSGVTAISNYAFYNCSGLTSISIPNSVTSIGNYAFYGCSGLTSVSISNSVTSIGSYTFYNCSGLTSISIPNSVTRIGDDAFRGCSGLTSLTIPSSVTSIGEASFAGCSALASITVQEGNPKYHSAGNCLIETSSKPLVLGCKNSIIPTDGSVTKIGDYAFYNCTGLTSLTIPNIVTSIGNYAFCGCSGLTAVTIPNTVTSIGFYAFNGCTGLTAVTIPNTVTSIGNYAFYNCPELTDVYYYGTETDRAAIVIGTSNTRLTSATWHYISFAYTLKGDGTYEVTGIGTVAGSALVISSTYNGKAVTSIAANAFKDCTSITSATIPGSVTSIGQGAFSGCSSLETMTIPFVGAEAGKTENDTYQYPFGYIFGTASYTGGTSTSQYYYGTSTTSTTSTQYVIPSSLRRVTVTGGSLLRGAFYNCKMIESVTLEDGVNIIGTHAFYYCSALTSVTLPSDLTAIPAYTFYNCTALSVVTIPSGVTSIGSYAFAACRSLLSITIPASVTSIGGSAFYDCNKLIEVCNLSSLTIQAGSSGYGYVGYYAQNVYTTVGGSKLSANADGYVLYSDGATVRLVSYVGTSTELSVPANVTIIHDYAFYNRRDLLSVTIPSGVTAISNYAFYNCSGLTSISIPNSVTSIGNYAFNGCTGLSSLSIPNSVTSIGEGAFYGCTGLTSLTIGSGLTSIGNIAFYGCTGLTSLAIPSSVTSIGETSFAGCSALASITVQEGNPKYHSAGDCLIETSSKTLVLGCKNSVIPSDGSVTSIGICAFYGCTGLTSISIPNSVTSIGSYAFNGCSALTSITIPNSVTSIGSYAFYNCTGLTSVTFKNTSGWMVSGTAVTVTNPTQNATYFKSTYRDYYWNRS